MVILVLTLVSAMQTCILPWAYDPRKNTCLLCTYSGQNKNNHVIIYKYTVNETCYYPTSDTSKYINDRNTFRVIYIGDSMMHFETCISPIYTLRK